MAALGFDHVSSDFLVSFMLIAVVAATLMGYVADAVMSDAGLGILGNAVIAFLGAGAAVVGWNKYVEPVAASDPVALIAAAGASSILLLMTIVLVRRFA